ncbi:DUF4340 domain-containing protein [Paracidobacterium acidisoli]|uniref:DUF4340 domain-containing protein n=1 Tax=Paracidobacterium acidisoli TaxID=2303751 RepID=A0A372IN85_9BACT|nr:DUF4340 domain-containing protein [Paracidobacterium acidisoli]MBT9332092.1 DUF4340 domain-containing protein [Paracidobacterium acidisoli]
MKLRSLMVAALVLLILAGVLYWSGHHKSSTANVSAAADAAPAILHLSEPDITQLTVARKGSAPVILEKTGSGSWQITAPKQMRADQTNVSGILNTVSSLDSERVVENKAGDLSSFGLSQPSLEIDIGEKNHTTQKLLLGDDTPTGSAVYAMVEGDPRVFTTYSYYKNSLDKGLDDLRDKRLLTADSDKITRIELIRKNMDVTFDRGKDGWQIVKPEPLRADNSQVQQLVSGLTGATMDLNGAHSKDAAALFAAAQPIAIAKVTDDTGTETLEVRESKGQYYAKSSAVEGVYETGSDTGSALDRSEDDFRNHRLFDFDYDEPNRVEVRSGADSWLFTRNGGEWWSAGKQMNADDIESLVSKLRDLSAGSFVSSGFTAPGIEITVTSNEGKRVEIVQIAKAAHECIARRQNEPSLYRLDAGIVDDLTKAAAAIQPAKK